MVDLRRIRVDPRAPAEPVLAQAVEVLSRSGVVAYPTETFYGLGAAALDEDACQRVFEIKGRPRDSPLPWIVADLGQIESVARLDRLSRLLVSRFWPGPLTLVVPLSRGQGTVAVRVSSLPIARALAKGLGAPITATSANRAGEPAPVTADEVAQRLREIDLLLDGGPCAGGLPSTIVDVTAGGRPILVRAGAVAYDDILRFLDESPTVG
ncbi:MAG TPA: L-threonylcarbamoyladenylate synthase [Vicinamibacteria bacterium]|nr:L-threonylcarbamoyladenylate synthase [Vicinamibacteria bacterium]